MSADHRIHITESEAGQRLDHVLAARLGIARRRVWRMLDAGQLTLNGQTRRKRDKGRALTAGDELGVTPLAEAEALQPNEALSITELARGDDWLVVAKPAGTAVHPLTPDEHDTLLNAVVANHPEIAGVGEGGLRGGVVHRLDVATSGALLLALSEQHWQSLRKSFEAGRVTKVYHALVQGRIDEPARLQRHLRIARHRPARVEVRPAEANPPKDGRLCALSYRPIERFAQWTLLEVHLETGFLHQIRAMLAAIGHPVRGDTRYSQRSDSSHHHEHPAPPPPRLMLHAHHLSIEAIEATCPWPDDFAKVIAREREITPRSTDSPDDPPTAF